MEICFDVILLIRPSSPNSSYLVGFLITVCIHFSSFPSYLYVQTITVSLISVVIIKRTNYETPR